MTEGAFDLFELLEETYKFYPASVVEDSREITVSKRSFVANQSPEYHLQIRIGLTNRDAVYYRQVYTQEHLYQLRTYIRTEAVQRDFEHMLRKLEAAVNAQLDRTNKEPWT